MFKQDIFFSPIWGKGGRGGNGELFLAVLSKPGRGAFLFSCGMHVVCVRDDWRRNPFSQRGLAVPDNASPLGFGVPSSGAARGGLLGMAEPIQPLIWSGQGKLLPLPLQAT